MSNGQLPADIRVKVALSKEDIGLPLSFGAKLTTTEKWIVLHEERDRKHKFCTDDFRGLFPLPKNKSATKLSLDFKDGSRYTSLVLSTHQSTELPVVHEFLLRAFGKVHKAPTKRSAATPSARSAVREGTVTTRVPRGLPFSSSASRSSQQAGSRPASQRLPVENRFAPVLEAVMDPEAEKIQPAPVDNVSALVHDLRADFSSPQTARRPNLLDVNATGRVTKTDKVIGSGSASAFYGRNNPSSSATSVPTTPTQSMMSNSRARRPMTAFVGETTTLMQKAGASSSMHFDDDDSIPVRNSRVVPGVKEDSKLFPYFSSARPSAAKTLSPAPDRSNYNRVRTDELKEETPKESDSKTVEKKDSPFERSWKRAVLPKYPRGMTNLGNSCYMNATLQSFIAIPSFVTRFRTCVQTLLDGRLDGSTDYQPTALLSCTDRVFAAVLKNIRKENMSDSRQYTGDQVPIQVLRDLRKAAGHLNAEFDSYKQQDAQEFMSAVLNQIKEELNGVKSKPLQVEENKENVKSEMDEGDANLEQTAITTPTPKKSQAISRDPASPIALTRYNPTKVFEVGIMNTVGCEGCHLSNVTMEQVLDMQLSFGASNDELSMQSLLEMRLARSSVEERKCGECGHVGGFMSHAFKDLPDCLIFALKRFEFNEGGRGAKSRKTVKVNRELFLKDLCVGSKKKKRESVASQVVPPLRATAESVGTIAYQTSPSMRCHVLSPLKDTTAQRRNTPESSPIKSLFGARRSLLFNERTEGRIVEPTATRDHPPTDPTPDTQSSQWSVDLFSEDLDRAIDKGHLNVDDGTGMERLHSSSPVPHDFERQASQESDELNATLPLRPNDYCEESVQKAEGGMRNSPMCEAVRGESGVTSCLMDLSLAREITNDDITIRMEDSNGYDGDNSDRERFSDSDDDGSIHAQTGGGAKTRVESEDEKDGDYVPSKPPNRRKRARRIEEDESDTSSKKECIETPSRHKRCSSRLLNATIQTLDVITPPTEKSIEYRALPLPDLVRIGKSMQIPEASLETRKRWYTMELSSACEMSRTTRPATTSVGGDGNCLFRTLSWWICTGHQDRHREVRDYLCDFIKEHSSVFTAFLKEGEDMDTHLRSMGLDGTWGTQVELVAAATMFKCRIYTYHEGRWHSFDPQFHYEGDEVVHGYSRKAVPFESRNGAIYIHNDDNIHFSPATGPAGEVSSATRSSRTRSSVKTEEDEELERVLALSRETAEWGPMPTTPTRPPSDEELTADRGAAPVYEYRAGDGPVYTLAAVVIHAGMALDSGHYYSYTWDSVKGIWLECNDSTITTVSEELVLKEAARQGYMFFYRRRHEGDRAKFTANEAEL